MEGCKMEARRKEGNMGRYLSSIYQILGDLCLWPILSEVTNE